MSAKIYMGEVVSVEGTTPGPAPTYTVRWLEPSGFKTLSGVRPSYWKWDALNVDEDGAKTVGDHTAVIVFHQAETYAFLFFPAPLVGECT